MIPAIRRLEHYLMRHVDGVLLTFTLVLMTVGLLTLFSASNASAVRSSAQLANMVVALCVMWLFANIPPISCHASPSRSTWWAWYCCSA